MLWDDNYFSLLPGEKRELTARLTIATSVAANRYWKSAAGISRVDSAAWT